MVDTLLSANGQAPSPPTLFSELLRDEFTSFPLLFHTLQQLSENFPEATISLQCILYFCLLSDTLPQSIQFCKEKKETFLIFF